VVQRYDSLWKIADRHLGDPRRWTEIWELNRNSNQGGIRFTDPNRIHRGWTLVLPADATTGAPPAAMAPPPPAADVTPAPAPVPDPALDPTPVPPPQPPPVTVASPAAAPSTTVVTSTVPTDIPAPPPAAPSAPAEAAHRAPEPAPGSHQHQRLPVVPAVVAGGVVMALTSLRRRQQRDRRPGRLTATPPARLEATERRLRAIADAELAAWVDATNRFLTASLIEAGGAPDDLTIACLRVGPLGVELLIQGGGPPPPGFVADDDHTWRVDPTLTLDDVQTRGDGHSPALPGLLTIGVTDDGAILVDTETAGALTVDGDPERVAAFLAGAALEAATAPWAFDIDLTLIGGDEHLANLEGVELMGPDQLATKIPSTSEHGETTLTARTAPTNRDARAPRLVVATEAGSAIDAAIAAAIPRRSALAVVAPAGPTTTTWRLTIDADGHAIIDPLGLRVTAAVDATAVAEAAQLLRAATDTTDAAPVVTITPNQSPGPDQPTTATTTSHEAAEGDDTKAASAAVEPDEHEPADQMPDDLCPAVNDDDTAAERIVVALVLGPVEVTVTVPRGRRRSAELLAYLAVHDRPIPGERLRAALWPLADDDSFGEISDATFHSTVSRARSALAQLGEPATLLPDGRAAGSFQLDRTLESDWTRFQRLTAAARRASSNDAIDLLTEALALVRGEPFAEVPPNTYAWAWSEQLVTDIETAVADAADQLAQLAIDAGDPDAAAWACQQGLLAVPNREGLYRRLMEAADQQGDLDGVHSAWRRAVQAAKNIDDLEEVQPETQLLYDRLTRDRRTANQA
jgi:DNA-binding SARP family transcriptional activator